MSDDLSGAGQVPPDSLDGQRPGAGGTGARQSFGGDDRDDSLIEDDEQDDAPEGSLNKQTARFTDLPSYPALDALKAVAQWVAWLYEDRGGPKLTKPPISPRTGRHASVSDPGTWASYAEAADLARRRKLPGVGFVLTAHDDVCGIDLDGCRDAETGVIAPWAAEIIAFTETYAEVSPSGTGIRLFARGKPAQARKADAAGVEIYGERRYLTVTGNHVAGTPTEIRPAPLTLEALARRIAEHAPAHAAKARNANGTAAQPRTDSFFGRVNAAALQNLDRWVPTIFGSDARLYPTTGAWRVSSRRLGRDLQEDLSIAPNGIVDFGVADMGDPRQGKRTAIDLVIEYGKAADAAGAAFWLCEQIGLDPTALGWEGRGDPAHGAEMARRLRESFDRKERDAEAGDGPDEQSSSDGPAGHAASDNAQDAGEGAEGQDSSGGATDQPDGETVGGQSGGGGQGGGSGEGAAGQSGGGEEQDSGGDASGQPDVETVGGAAEHYDLPDSALHPPGVVGELTDWIVDWTDEPIRLHAVGAALTIVGALVARKVYTLQRPAGPCLYIGALAASGVGKQHPQNCIKLALNEVHGKLHTGWLSSSAAMAVRLEEHPAKAMVVDEFCDKLAGVRQRNAPHYIAALSEALRSLWGLNQGEWRPDVVLSRDESIIHRPALSIYGAATLKDFTSGLASKEIVNGLYNRFLILPRFGEPEPTSEREGTLVLPPALRDQLLSLHHCLDDLQMAMSMRGAVYPVPILVPFAPEAAAMNEANKAYQKSMMRLADEDAGLTIYGRYAEMIKRIALILACGRMPEDLRQAEISAEDMAFGEQLVRFSAENFVLMIRRDMTESWAEEQHKMVLGIIRKARRIDRTLLYRKIRGRLKKRDIDDVIASLLEGRNVDLVTHPTGGRPKIEYLYVRG